MFKIFTMKIITLILLGTAFCFSGIAQERILTFSTKDSINGVPKFKGSFGANIKLNGYYDVYGGLQDSELADYDFKIRSADIETPELWIVMASVHNLGTRDAANVPIRVENEAGRKILDVVPLVQGKGQGVVAIRVGYLWTHGGTLTFTINPQDADGAYPETNQGDNVATFTLP